MRVSPSKLPSRVRLLRPTIEQDDSAAWFLNPTWLADGDYEELASDIPASVQPARATIVSQFAMQQVIVSDSVYVTQELAGRLNDVLEVTSGPQTGRLLRWEAQLDQAGRGVHFEIVAQGGP